MKGLFLFMLLGFSFQSYSQDLARNYYHEVEKIIRYDTEIQYENTPGIQIGILIDSVAFALGYGQFDTLLRPAEDQFLFQLGGLSKIFGALLTRILAEQNVLEIDKPVNYYLSEAYQNRQLDSIRVQDLLSHTSGLPMRIPDFLIAHSQEHLRYTQMNSADLLELWSGLDRENINASPFTYSHLNYAILDVVLERASGKTIEQLLKTYIFAPLGLTGTTLAKGDLDYTTAYDKSGRSTPPFQFTSFYTSMGICSTMEDLLLLMKSLLSKKSPIIQSAFYKNLNHKFKIPGSKRSYVAEAWHFFNNRKFPDIYLHSGITAGHGALIYFIRESKTAVIILTNSTYKLDGLGMLILRLINNNWKHVKEKRKK